MRLIRKAGRSGFAFLAAAILLTACQAASVVSTPSDSTSIPTSTVFPTAVPTVQPTPLPTQADFGPSRSVETPLPAALSLLTPQNAAQLAEVARWGKGLPRAQAVSPDGSRVAVASSSGLQFYDSASGALMQEIETRIPLTALAYAPQGNWIAGGDALGLLSVWNTADGSLNATLGGQGFTVRSLAFSPDGTQLAAAGWDGALRIWRMEDGSLLRTISDLRRGAQALAFSADGSTLLAWSSGDPLKYWPLTGGKDGEWYIGQVTGGSTGTGAAFSADGSAFAVIQEWRIKVYNPSNGTTRSLLQPVTAPVRQVALSADGSLAAAADQKAVKIWQTKDGQLLNQVDFSGSLSGLAFSSDSQTLFVVGEQLLRYDFAQSPQAGLTALSPSQYRTAHLADWSFSSDGTALVEVGLDGSVQAFALNGGPTPENSPALGQFDAAALSSDGSLLAGSTGGAAVQVWQLPEVEQRFNLRSFGLNVNKLAFSPDDSLLAAASGDRRVRIFTITDGKLAASFEMPGAVSRLMFSPDGNTLAAVSENLIQLRRVSDWALLQNITGTNLAFAPQSDLLAAASYDGRQQVVTVYRLVKQEEVTSFAVQGNSLAFSPDGSLLAVAGPTLTVWDSQSGALLAERTPAHPNAALRFSPDGSLLALAYWDGTLSLWGVP